MESLRISLNAVVPMFILMVIGYGLKGLHFFSDETLTQVNKLVFRLLLPMQLFRSSFQADLKQAVNIRFLLWTEVLVLLTFLCMVVVVPHLTPQGAKRGALLQGMFRGNIALVGMAIAQALFGQDQVGIMAVSVAVTVPLNNLLAVPALELFQGEKTDLRHMGREIITNPLIIGCFCGLAANALGFVLPEMVLSAVSSLADAATPVALLVLGASFHMERSVGDKQLIAIGVATKLILLPLVAVAIGVALGFRGVELGTMMVVFAAPTAVSSFTMAQQMGADSDLSASLVVFTGMGSCFTIFLWTFLLLQMGLI